MAGQKAALLRVPGYCAGEHAGEQLSRKRRYGSGPGQRVVARFVDIIVVGCKRQRKGGARPVGLDRGAGKAEAMARRATQLSEAALEAWARSLGTGV